LAGRAARRVKAGQTVAPSNAPSEIARQDFELVWRDGDDEEMAHATGDAECRAQAGHVGATSRHERLGL